MAGDRVLAIALAAGAALLTLAAGACWVDVDLTGKTCPCPSPLLCDESTNTCVETLAESASDDASAPPSSPPPAACSGTSCKCAVDGDCKDPRRGYCGPDKICVECLATPADTCTAGGYCNAKNQCTVGCKAEGDCPGGERCQTATHRCVECTDSAQCADGGPGQRCSPGGRCVEVCTGNGVPCGAGGTCCDGLCIGTASDVLNCGGCGAACSTMNGTPTCTDGACTWKCADGYAHCRPPGENSGCETSIREVESCGACGAVCSPDAIVFADGIACGATSCTYAACQQGHLDGDEDPTNGCERTCGNKNQRCCPEPMAPCNSGAACRSNGSCPP